MSDIEIDGELYERLLEHANATGTTPSAIVEQLLAPPPGR